MGLRMPPMNSTEHKQWWYDEWETITQDFEERFEQQCREAFDESYELHSGDQSFTFTVWALRVELNIEDENYKYVVNSVPGEGIEGMSVTCKESDQTVFEVHFQDLVDFNKDLYTVYKLRHWGNPS